MRLGFIGAGNMASALARGLREPILVHDVDRSRAEALAAEVRDGAKAVVSILGGVPVEAVEAAYPDRPVYRLMPSIPVEVGQGVVIYSPGRLAAQGPESELRGLLDRLGTVVELPEKLIDAATAVMSCAPAFYALVVEALADAGVKQGLTADVASHMAVETMAGTATVLTEQDRDAAALRRRVTSPGGMTERGVAALERAGIRTAFDDAVDAVVNPR